MFNANSAIFQLYHVENKLIINELKDCSHVKFKLFISGWFEATQAFETLGFLALLAALVMILVKCFAMKESRIPVIIRLALQIGAGKDIMKDLGVIQEETNPDISLNRGRVIS